MPKTRSVEEVVAAIEDMSPEEREDLLLRMAKMDDLLEDLSDVADLLKSSREASRPYEDFLSEVKASRHHV
jgi:uncharacterized protein Yka (UPF0111/DUF47 family)